MQLPQPQVTEEVLHQLAKFGHAGVAGQDGGEGVPTEGLMGRYELTPTPGGLRHGRSPR